MNQAQQGEWSYGPLYLQPGDRLTWFFTIMVDGRATDTELFAAAASASDSGGHTGGGDGGMAYTSLAGGDLAYAVELAMDNLYKVLVHSNLPLSFIDIHFKTSSTPAQENYRMVMEGSAYVHGYIALNPGDVLEMSFTYGILNNEGLVVGSDSEIVAFAPDGSAAPIYGDDQPMPTQQPLPTQQPMPTQMPPLPTQQQPLPEPTQTPPSPTNPPATCADSDFECQLRAGCNACYTDATLPMCNICLALEACQDQTCQIEKTCELCNGPWANQPGRPFVCSVVPCA